MSSATGRLSSDEPRLQNIPVRTALGDTIRRCFALAPARATTKRCSDGGPRCGQCRRHAIVIALFHGCPQPLCQRHYRKSLPSPVRYR